MPRDHPQTARLRQALAASAPFALVLAALAIPAVLVLGARWIGFAGGTLPLENGAAFSDEFASPPLDSASWAVETPWHRQYTTGERQWYDPANVGFSDGSLRLTTRKERVTAKPPSGRTTYRYTSGIISSGSRADLGGTSRVSFTYGYFEMRAKLPRGQGLMPAFWLTNDAGSEIDIFEMPGPQSNKVYMSLHRTVNGVHVDSGESFTGPDFSAGFHTFAVDWQPSYVRYYIDGVERAEFTGDIPSKPLWMVANTAVGGEWPGDPGPGTVFPQYYDIDYIRVWPGKPGPTEPQQVSLPPTAGPDSYTTPRDTPLGVPAPGVLGNDHDPDGDRLTSTLVTPPVYGTADLGYDGSLTYVPPSGFSGVDTLTYTCSDGKSSSSAMVTITVRPAWKKR